MKSKKKTYVLLILVLSVWGTIIYKVITGLDPDVPELALQESAKINTIEFNTTIDTFSISKVDRDPFLGTITKQRSNVSTKVKREPLVWQPIDYLGVVNTANKKLQVFIVNVNRKQYLLKIGQIKDSIKLLNGNENRIVLSYKDQQKIVPIKKQ